MMNNNKKHFFLGLQQVPAIYSNYLFDSTELEYIIFTVCQAVWSFILGPLIHSTFAYQCLASVLVTKQGKCLHNQHKKQKKNNKFSKLQLQVITLYCLTTTFRNSSLVPAESSSSFFCSLRCYFPFFLYNGNKRPHKIKRQKVCCQQPHFPPAKKSPQSSWLGNEKSYRSKAAYL